MKVEAIRALTDFQNTSRFGDRQNQENETNFLDSKKTGCMDLAYVNELAKKDNGVKTLSIVKSYLVEPWKQKD